ncbi:hypothetical protein VNO80_17309 [Phaseolus coccineus]|uniref:Uncharacterized protein n=1 Tax=Phaseolus coccineus TaxID=3886 RepID=A0AAN9R0X0_PHACN
MSQQQNQNQNLPVAPQSGAGLKPFSIRQYVLGCRHRNISQNWPFEEKHLQLCLKNGLKLEELLPPLEPGKTSHDDNKKEIDSCNAEVPQGIDDECNYKVSNHPSSHEEGKQSNHQNWSNKSANLSQPEERCTLSSSTNVHKSSPAVSPPKAVKHKRKRRKGKCKKRSMMDILAVAQHSTLEEIDGMNGFCDAETVIEGCDEAVPCQHISMAEAVNEDSCRKGGSEDHVM